MLRLTLSCLAVAVLAPFAQAATHRVPSEYPTIQAGIDACQDGDTVLVAAGVYSCAGNTELRFNEVRCSLRSEAGSGETMIDCLGNGAAFSLSQDGASEAIIEGFTLQGAGSNPGGAIRANEDSLTIRDCRFVDNASGFGGAIDFANGKLRVERCVFDENTASYDGGAIDASVGASLEVIECQFLGNSAGAKGGGISAAGADSVVVRDCLFSGNRAGAIGAGALLVAWHATVERVQFLENSSNWDGGALLLSGSDATTRVRDCLFVRNRAEGRDGGAIAMGLDAFSPGSANLEDCLFYDNTAKGGGAVSCGNYSAPTFRSCTFIANSATAGRGGALSLYWHSEPILEQVLIAQNTQGGGIRAVEGSVPHMSCSNSWGNVGGNFIGFEDPTGSNGNISADPRFCGAQPDDFTLQANSPCAPANNTCGVLMGLYDVNCDSVSVQSKSWGGIKSMY
jgi:predicted outer membrane repeat protein